MNDMAPLDTSEGARSGGRGGGDGNFGCRLLDGGKQQM